MAYKSNQKKSVRSTSKGARAQKKSIRGGKPKKY